MDADLLGRMSLGSLTATLLLAAVAVLAQAPLFWAVAWLLALTGAAAGIASFVVRRRERRRLREELDALAAEWD